MLYNYNQDLDSLLLSVRDMESKRLAQEAITAYQAGAFRAAILSIWVSVCADIINKLKELSTGGDASAVVEIQKLNQLIQAKNLKGLQQFENGLIDLARDTFQMLLPHESTDLERLRDDRNLCAHPAFISDDALFSPTPEITRAHIAHAILHLLSRPPVQGKQLIARYDRDLMGGSFPNNPKQIEIVLRQNYLIRAKPGMVVSMIKALAKALVGTDAVKYKGKEDEIAFSLAAIGTIYPGPFDENLPPLIERLGREVGDTQVLTMCHYIGAEKRIWNWLGDAGQARILAKIQNVPFSELLVVTKARHVTEIGEHLLARLKKEGTGSLVPILKKAPCRAFVKEALELYKTSGDFATAEMFGNELIIPHAQYFLVEDIAQLNTSIRGNAWNQILKARETSRILSQVFSRTKNLLPDTKSHWSAIAQYIAEIGVSNDYEFPTLLEDIHKSGLVPATK